MRALLYEHFREAPRVTDVPTPACPDSGVLIQVEATGLCRSDWHGWMGHDAMITLPNVPGHEFSGTIVEIGSQVRRFQVGDRVTAPFVCGCGHCEFCDQGDPQVCPQQTQPGFSHWGSFAEYVAIHEADLNLVRLPEALSFQTAASLGCRFATAFRAIVDLARLRSGETLAIFGCGGVGLSALLIAKALGSRVIAVDISPSTLQKAKELGADEIINSSDHGNVSEHIHEMTQGGVHVAIDALGKKSTFQASIQSLRKRGRHVQVGLLTGPDENPATPMGKVIADELQLFGSHGIQAARYPALFERIGTGKIPVEELITSHISLDQAGEHLMQFSRQSPTGITVIDTFT